MITEKKNISYSIMQTVTYTLVLQRLEEISAHPQNVSPKLASQILADITSYKSLLGLRNFTIFIDQTSISK